jgi:fumarate hydratase class II
MTDERKRVERDSMGSVEVPENRLWGAQTQRSLEHFRISDEKMPMSLIRALAVIKRAAAAVNLDLGEIDPRIAGAIIFAANEVLEGKHDGEFPLSVWQTGSGTQTNMNVNEVLANRASEILGGPRGEGRLVHPNDHVNRGQSSNDVFPSAMAIASVEALATGVLPAVGALSKTLTEKSTAFRDIVKIGRTHLQDATPLTLGQEISGWVAQLDHALSHLESAVPHLSELALGGTAVGTGLNAHPDFGRRVAQRISGDTGIAFTSAPNKFESLAAHDAMVFAHGALKTLAVSLMKIANDVRLLSSGPRAGIGEIRIPENEPGSSIMPGKVNPTQSEALMMVCAQVLGHDVAINVGGSFGNLELNVMKPLIAHDFLSSARLLADAMSGFRVHCAAGIEPVPTRIRANLENSLMLVTALVPHIGYDAAASIAEKAHADGTTLREAALALGLVTERDYDDWVKPEKMIGPTKD